MELKEILNHESGDSWNGTHFRDIEVRFDKAAETVEITSRNQMFFEEKRTELFTLSSLKAQFDDARGARYFGSFCAAAGGTLPGLKVEGVTAGAFFHFVDGAEFAGGADAEKVFPKPSIRRI